MRHVGVHLPGDIAGIPIFAPRHDLPLIVAFEHGTHAGGNFVIVLVQRDVVETLGKDEAAVCGACVDFAFAVVIGQILLLKRRDDLLAKLADSLQSLPVAGEGGDAHKEQVSELVEWVQRVDDYGAWMTERNLADVSAVLGKRFDQWADAAKALEAHVLEAPASQDAEIISLLAAIEGRRLQVFGPTRLGLAARNVVLPQTRE